MSWGPENTEIAAHAPGPKRPRDHQAYVPYLNPYPFPTCMRSLFTNTMSTDVETLPAQAPTSAHFCFSMADMNGLFGSDYNNFLQFNSTSPFSRRQVVLSPWEAGDLPTPLRAVGQM